MHAGRPPRVRVPEGFGEMFAESRPPDPAVAVKAHEPLGKACVAQAAGVQDRGQRGRWVSRGKRPVDSPFQHLLERPRERKSPRVLNEPLQNLFGFRARNRPVFRKSVAKRRELPKHPGRRARGRNELADAEFGEGILVKFHEPPGFVFLQPSYSVADRGRTQKLSRAVALFETLELSFDIQ